MQIVHCNATNWTDFLYINYCFSNDYNLGIFHQHHAIKDQVCTGFTHYHLISAFLTVLLLRNRFVLTFFSPQFKVLFFLVQV